jgi:hypothetical protein
VGFDSVPVVNASAVAFGRMASDAPGEPITASAITIGAGDIHGYTTADLHALPDGVVRTMPRCSDVAGAQ